MKGVWVGILVVGCFVGFDVGRSVVGDGGAVGDEGCRVVGDVGKAVPLYFFTEHVQGKKLGLVEHKAPPRPNSSGQQTVEPKSVLVLLQPSQTAP